MKNAFFTFWVLFYSFTLFSCTLSKQEVEPNDDLLEVSKNSFHYTTPFKIQGTFSTVNDIDHFPIKIDQDGFYSVSVSSIKGIDSRLTLYNQNLEVIAISDDYYQNFGEYIPMIHLKKGRYFIKVEINNKTNISYKTSNRYTIFVKEYSPKIPDLQKLILTKKPYNTLQSVQQTFLNIPLIGYYQPALALKPHEKQEKAIIDYLSKNTNKDLTPFNARFFTFSLDKAGDYLLNLDLSSVNDFDPIIGFFETKALNDIIEGKPPKGEYLIKDDNEFDLGESIFNYSISGKKTYVVVILARCRLNYKDLKEAQKNYYKLQISTKLRSSAYEKEPNDTIAQANPIQNVFTKGILDSFYDSDFFSLKERPLFFEWFGQQKKPKKILDLPTYASITLSSDYATGLTFDILNSEGQIIKTVESFPSQNYDAFIRNFYIAPKTYYFIKVHYPSYLENSKVDKETHYQLEVNMYKRPYSDMLLELEPNDFSFTTKENPHQLNFVRQSFVGYINHKQDIDQFFYKVEKSGTYTMFLEGIPHISFIIKLFHSNILFKTITTRPGAIKHQFQQYLTKGQTLKIELTPQEPEYFNPYQPYVFTIYKPGKTPYDELS